MEIASSSVLQKKSSKIDSLILDVKNEIAITTTFLDYIKEHSVELVENLKNIALPSLYLQEFVKVNSVLLDFIRLLTEINCKFEILQLTKTKNFDKESVDVFCKNKNLEKDDRISEVIKGFKKEDAFPPLMSINSDSVGFVCEYDKNFPQPDLYGKKINHEENPEVFSDVQNSKVVSFQGSLQEYSITPSKNNEYVEPTNKCHKKVENKRLIDKENNKESIKLKTEDILVEVGKEFEVEVEYIQSPSEFYVNFSSKSQIFQEFQSKLKKISYKIQEVQNTNKSLKKSSISKKFDSDVLYYSVCDEAWFRAKVIDWNLEFDDDLIFIFLVDTGESKCIQINFIHSMPNHLKKYPVFIKKCHLYNTLPINMKDSDNSPNWMKGTCEKMKYWIEASKKKKIKIAPKDHFYSTSSLPVVLWLAENNKSVNELLINFNLAKQYLNQNAVLADKKNSVVKDINMDNWNPMKEDFESYKNTYDLDVRDPAAVIYGYVGNDYTTTCRHFAKRGFCSKGKFCWKEHKILNPLGYTTDEEKIFKNAYNSFPSPIVGEIYEIEVTSICEINEFYCITITSPHLEETISTLTSYMNSSQNVSEMEKLVVPPAIGQIVIAQYSEDNAWYRAKVLESEPENDLYTVIFVDFGNKEEKSLSCVRAIEPRYLHLPFQAIKCNINGIEPNRSSSKEEAIEYLRRQLEGKDSKIKVISIFPGDDLSLLVDLYDDKGNDVGQDLIKKNFAAPKNQIIVNDNSEILPG